MKFFALAVLTAVVLAGCASGPSSGPASAPAKPPKEKNLALGATVVANNHILDYAAENAVDGETSSYYEGAANEFPNELTVDLGKKAAIKDMVLRLNPKRLWAGRTQTIEILSGDDGVFTSLVPPTEYFFDPLDGNNLVTIPLDTSARFFQLKFTSNTEATGGQIAEWEIHPAP